MFCGTTVDLMAKMMTAGRRLAAFWRTHSILEGSGQSSEPSCHWHWAAFWSPVLAVCLGSARPSQLSTARWQPASSEQQLICQKGWVLHRQSMGSLWSPPPCSTPAPTPDSAGTRDQIARTKVKTTSSRKSRRSCKYDSLHQHPWAKGLALILTAKDFSLWFPTCMLSLMPVIMHNDLHSSFLPPWLGNTEWHSYSFPIQKRIIN